MVQQYKALTGAGCGDCVNPDIRVFTAQLPTALQKQRRPFLR